MRISGVHTGFSSGGGGGGGGKRQEGGGREASVFL